MQQMPITRLSVVSPKSPERLVGGIDQNHPARVDRDYLTDKNIKASAQARRLEYVSPLTRTRVGLNTTAQI